MVTSLSLWLTFAQLHQVWGGVAIDMCIGTVEARTEMQHQRFKLHTDAM